MPKQKIGKDALGKGAARILTTPKEEEEFEQWQEERAKQEEKEEKPKEQVELTSKMPTNEGEITDEQMAQERQEIYEDMEKAKAEGKLKPVHVREHHRSYPKTEEEEEENG